MDLSMIKLSLIFCMITPVVTGLQVLLDNDQCGRVINLAEEHTLVLHYDWAGLGFPGDSVCRVNITNDNVDDMICIEEVSSILNKHCDQALTYYIENLSTKHPQVYDCSCFNERPLCHGNNRSFIVFKQHNAKLRLKIYARTYYNKMAGAIATAVGGAAAFVLFVICMGAYVKRSFPQNHFQRALIESGHQHVPEPDVGSICNEQLSTEPPNFLFSPPPYFNEPPPPYPSDPWPRCATAHIHSLCLKRGITLSA